MFRTVGARRYLALGTLAAFLLAQPAVGCATLCLFQRHVAEAHPMSGMNRDAALTSSACHRTNIGAVQRPPLQILSPMQPASTPIMAMAPDRWIEPLWILPTAPRLISHSIEPPPPRLV